MRLTNEGIKDRLTWESKDYKLPNYDRQRIITNTQENPNWIHFGAGNIFRAFQANVVDKLLDEGIVDKGIIVAEGYDYEIIEKYNRACDDLSILAILKANGSVEKKVIGSIVESCILDKENEKEIERLREIFRAPSLQIVSFTITEKGYKTRAYMSKVVGLILERFKAGAYPISLVSMDNCSHNGDKLKEAVLEYAKDLLDEGKCDPDFISYLQNPKIVSFPLTMIDKITPRPDDTVKKILIEDGVEGAEPVVTSKNTYVANFVNAEETEYLVIEDLFPNGRPALERGGIIFTNRITVDKTEKMKVCTCLNPLHTALAIFGCILGYDTIHDEMNNPALKKMVTILGKEEGMKTVINPGVISPDDFLDAVLTKRLPNPFMPDTPQRIACDTSQKLPIRFGETIKAYRANSSLGTNKLNIIPLVLAGYLRYLDGIDDEGKPFEQSPDPLLDELKGMPAKDILKRTDVFGVDLYEDNLASRILEIYSRMQGKGNVRKELEKL